VPLTALAFNWMLEPAQSVEGPDATGAGGVEITVTAITVAELPHPPTLMARE
jgi:hypothetical protein